jgi:putative DNA primase/helicase
MSQIKRKFALEYAARGWQVFPCHFITTNGTCSCGEDCGSAGKHPMTYGGLNDATTDEQQIRDWWSQSPYANVGIRTGEVSGITAIDIDPRHDGDATWRELEQTVGPIPDTPTQTTGGNGQHIIVNYTPRLHSQNDVAQGIDVKNNGGYILAEPSNHASGGTYEWELALHYDDHAPVDLAEAWPNGLQRLVDLQQGNRPQLTRTTQQSGTGERIEREAGQNLTAGQVIAEGSRNATLTSIAGSLRRRGLDAEQIAAMLHQYNQQFCSPELDATEVDRIAQGMMRYEPAPPLPSTIDPELGVTAESASTPSGGGYNVVGLPMTDGGNRDRLVARYGSQILYVPEQGWHLWDGVRWRLDNETRIQEMALDTARTIRAEERTGIVDKQGVDIAEKWSLSSESLVRVNAMIKLAQSHPSIVCGVSDLDTHPFLYNAANTTVDLLTGETLDPDPTHRLTQRSRMIYKPDATCPYWCEFVGQILREDKAVIRHLQKYLGLALTGDMTSEAMFILYGEGANGKSILLEVLAYLMGDYLSTAPAHTFLSSSRNESIRNDLAMLRGARLVTVSETNKGSSLDEAVIKRTVSGDQETARFLHKEYFSFHPQYKILLATNNKPEIKGGTHGTWRRLHLIEFGVKFGSAGHPAAGKKDEIIARLKSEASGILNWLIEGYQLYRCEGLEQPDAVRDSTASYREDQDPLIDFFGINCALGSDYTVTTSDLREAYNAHTGEDRSAVWFGRLMSEHGYKPESVGGRGNRTRVYRGLMLSEDGQALLARNEYQI